MEAKVSSGRETLRLRSGGAATVEEVVSGGDGGPSGTMQETQVQTLGREDLLEKEMVTHSSILAWKIPWMEEPGRLQSMGSQIVGHD